MSDDRQTPRTGITWRRPERPAPAPRSTDPRAYWVMVLAALLFGAVGLAWVLGWGPTGDDDARTILAPSPSQTHDVTAAPTEASATGQPTPTTMQTAEPTPTTMQTAEPTPTAAPSEPAPTALSTGLAIDFPADGETVISRVINVIGTGPPGATITRDIPLWFDDHTTIRDDGLWMLRVELNEGPNDLTFRIGDDRSTERRITVVYQADG